MTYELIKNNPEIRAFIKKGNDNLATIGFTDHSETHSILVAQRAAFILDKFGFGEHEKELVRIAGFMHDIGNAINRAHHAEYGALLANSILEKTDISLEDRVIITSSIANHDESTGGAVDVISAALIIADKTDVRRSRVRNKEITKLDIHDRVNYAVTDAKIEIPDDLQKITLNLQIDESMCSMFEYFEIFLGRMMMCRKASEMLGAKFRLTANGDKIL